MVKRLRAGLLAGHTLILQRVTGPGTLFVHAAGDFAAFTLGQGEVLRADTDSLVWFDASVSYSAAWAGGVKRAFLGGEGLFLSTFTGPGRVTLQTMGHAPASGPGKTEKGCDASAAREHLSRAAWGLLVVVAAVVSVSAGQREPYETASPFVGLYQLTEAHTSNDLVE